MKITPEIEKRLDLLEMKFKNSGQDMCAYLDGLLYDEYITYWDYIKLDTLLSLQVTKTSFPDEKIFISYHQITELYFKLLIHEQEQIINQKELTADYFLEKIWRINRYFKVLINSFDVVINGLDRNQFRKFRMSLLPASGFQSAQNRIIEIYSTDLINLVHPTQRKRMREKSDASLKDLYDNIYWNKGGIDLKTGEKTLTLKQFEKRYNSKFLHLAKKVESKNINQVYLNSSPEIKDNKDVIDALRTLDENANVNWLLMHMGAAVRHLKVEGKDLKATGGTNWREFLPPSFQKIMFFPSLWNETEHEEWGRQWVTHQFNTEK